ncbi:MAG TPA: hypothetical protein VFD36_29295 [Kofleriaceae bacterium]|nr:hypothetical protein [Kofleriaceae bacterium]
MGYVDAVGHDGIGSDATVGSADQLVVAKLQAAINRVILGARGDGSLFLQTRQLAEQAPFVPLTVDGQLGNKTNTLVRFAGNVAGVTDVQLTTMSQVAKVAAALDAFSQSRGYPITDTVKIGAITGALPTIPGLPPTVGGLSTTMLAGGAILLGVVLAMRKRPNPSRRRRRRRR